MHTDRSRTRLATCSGLAIAAALAGSPRDAWAQTANPSFLGSATVSSGSATVTSGTGTTPMTTVNVNSDQAVIDWTPFDNATNPNTPIQFQQAGTATFQRTLPTPSPTPAPGPSGTNFAVLNRINPTDTSRPVQFNANVVSQFVTAAGGFAGFGGTVFFYSPGGVILGPGAVFNVGNLGLTSAPPMVDDGGNFIFGTTVNFQQAPVAGSRVEIQDTASIQAALGDSYVALVAPRVINDGDITVNGSAALVSADAATINFSPDGLFDIQVTSGTSSTGVGGNGQTLTNSGSVTGPAGDGLAASHRVYMVAVPKNDAITMAITGGAALGFDVAAAADTDGNAVILSGGYDIVDGDVSAPGVTPSRSSGGGTGLVDIRLTNAQITSDFRATATGNAFATAQNGTMSFASNALLEGARPGGTGALGAQLRAEGANGSLTVLGDATLRSIAADPFAADGTMRSGTLVQAAAVSGGSLDVDGDLRIESNAFGADSESAGTRGGAGVGGVAQVFIDNGDVDVGGNLAIEANGIGGSADSSGVGGGAGMGGAARVVFVNAAPSTLTVGGDFTAQAQGVGGSGRDCPACTVEGGLGQGGEARISAAGGAHSVIIDGNAFLTAAGLGGSATFNPAGAGIGGTSTPPTGAGGVALFADNGSTITVRSLFGSEGFSVALDASGEGGAHFDGGLGGDGTGGTARIGVGASGGSIALAGEVRVASDGEGGGSFTDGGTGGVGGDGFGTEASVFAPAGTISFGSVLTLSADGAGGFGQAVGGQGEGGLAIVNSGGGAINLAALHTIRAQGVGGDGFAAGEGSGGQARLVASNGTITAASLANTIVNADGLGGFAVDGGTGGDGEGGTATIFAASSLAGPSTITLRGVTVNANGVGGLGGDAVAPGAAGGTGGNGEGGEIVVTATAGNGNLVAQSVLASAGGIGGDGGLGGDIVSGTGTGGLGGTGGSAFGGSVELGIESGIDTPTNSGSANLGAVNLIASGVGGTGGQGGMGTTRGVGGRGGDGTGGSAVLLARGAPLTVTEAIIGANVMGGDGGAGATLGLSGAGITGEAGVVVSNRFQRAERGRLTADSISTTSSVLAAAGSGGGGSTQLGGVFFDVVNGDVTVSGNADFFADGNVVSPLATPDILRVANGTVDIGGSLFFFTNDTAIFDLANSAVNVDTLLLRARNFVLPATVPTAPGTITIANGFNLLSDLDFVTYANFVVNVDATFNSAGAFRVGNYTSTGDLILTATGPVTFGAIDADLIDLTSGTAISTAAQRANRSIDLAAAQGISTGSLSAGTTIDARAGGAITAGTVSAGQSVVLNAGTTLTAGAITAGTFPSSLFSMGLVGGGAVNVGNLTAAGSIGILSSTGSMTTGTIAAPGGLLGLARGAITTGAITTAPAGFVYFANSSMAAMGGALDQTFNPGPILAAIPVATTGPITIAGPVTTGNFRAASGGAFTIGTASSEGGPTTGGTVTAAGVVELTSGGALRAGNMTASDIELVSGAALTAGALTSSDTIGARGVGAVSLGDLSAGLVSPSTASDAEFSVGVASTGGAATVGTVAAARDIGILAGGGNLTAGTLTAGRDVLLLARDSVATGAITAGATGRITIANASLASLGGALDDFNPEPVFAAPPAPVTGAIAINGAVTGGTLTAAANGNFTPAGALTLGQRLTIARAATATVAAPWTAPMISVASQRLNFAESSTATIGGSATTSLTLRALASGQTAVLGGTSRGEGQGYVLTQGDFARLRSTNLAVQVDAQGGSSSTGARPDLEIRDLTLNGSAASGGLSSLTITTPGWARVVGDLLLAQAGSEDVLTVSGGSRLELVLPDASIAVTGAGGALAGRLQVSSNNLVAATLDLLAQAMADPTAAGLVAALRTPASTTANLDGYLRANAVTLISNANILLQNSGTARDFAGVTVGGGGLIIGRITPATGGGSTGGTGGTGGTTGGTTATSGFSFVGMLMTPSDVLLFDFAVDAASTVTLRTYSYAGGINAAGQVIARGGFDPILSLYNAEGVRIAQNDDGGSNVPADSVSGLRYDTFLTQEVAAGSYKVAVTVFPNFAPNNLSGTYAGATTFADTTGASRTPAFAFDVLGAQTATGPGTQTPSGPGGSSGGLNVVGFGRRVGVGGSQSITGEQFFATIDFGRSGENPVIYSDLSEFNTCLINTGSCGGLVPFEPGPTDPGTSATTTIQALARETLEEEPFEDSAEEDDEAEADAASSPIAPPAPLIDTRPLNPAVDVVEPVSGAGNPALIGSAVNEATAQSGQGDSQ